MESFRGEPVKRELGRRTGRRSVVSGLVVGTAASLTLPTGGAARQETKESESGHRVYFGWLLASEELAAVALDQQATQAPGVWDTRAYVCDGFGPPVGMAIWFRGDVDEESAHLTSHGVDLISATGQETLRVSHLDANAVVGTFIGSDGRPRRFAAFPAIAGAGIYDVTLDEDLVYRGTSTTGDVLSARVQDDVHVVGAILTPSGEEIVFDVLSLARLPKSDLEASGLPSGFTDYADTSHVPDNYIAVISPGGAFWLGRNGDVRGGKPGNNIIGNDCI